MNRPKRNYKSNKKLESVGDLLTQYFSNTGSSGTIAENVQIMSAWPEIVGARIAAVTRCEGVSDGILKIQVANAVWRHELMYMKKSILEKIAEKTGLKSVREITFY